MDIDKAIKIAIKTGKVTLGTKKTIRQIKLGKTQLVVIASNCPKETQEEILYYSKLSNIPIYNYAGTSWDLGSVCGRPHMVACLSVEQPGDSNILKLKEG